MTPQITDLQTHWPPIAPLFSIQSEADYDAAVERLNSLLDQIGTNEKHPLYGLLDTLGTLVHSYELEHHEVLNVSGPDALRYLMEEHGLSTAALADLVAPEALDRYLAGSQELQIEELRALARRFHVSPAAFL